MKIKSKLPEVGTSIFAIMSKMANDSDAINLSQGFPDFNCSDELIELVHKYQIDGFNQYAPMYGISDLRERIIEKVEKLYKRKYDRDKEIVITAGATQAIYTAISSSIHSGDEVIIFEPAYDSYSPSVKMNGGIPVFIPLDEINYRINWNKVKDSISSKTKLIIINSPHNPTGSIINEDDIKNLEEITRDTNILILSDEVYEHIVFEGKHISLSESEELSKRAFVISSFGKTYHTTGWKMGYCLAPVTLMKEMLKVHQFIVFAVNTPIQYAYAEFMKNEEYYLNLGSFYKEKRDVFLNEMKDSKFKFEPAKGTYFQLLNYKNISDMNDMEFTEYLTKEIGVATIPLSPFISTKNNNRNIRVCFAKQNEVLIEAAEKLKSL